jgi:hypothetical protein
MEVSSHRVESRVSTESVRRITFGDIAAICEQPYDHGTADEVLVTCSDGRFTVEEDGVLSAIGITRPPDRQVIPGGAGALAGVGNTDATTAHLSDLHFLISAHAIRRVVLVAHADCGVYASRYAHIASSMIFAYQLEDLVAVARKLVEDFPSLEVDCLYAMPVDGHVALVSVGYAE